MIELQNISKVYKDFQLSDINISIETGEYYVLLGKSGAGKSIILEIIAGLISPDKGKVIHNNEDITGVTIQKRNIGLVFQDYSVFPHMTVRKNIEYPLKSAGINKHEIEKVVVELAEKTGISHLLHRNPTTLSGGEQQRVAIARTLARKPDCLLLDEPLSSLDIQLREDIRKLLRKLNREGITIIHVTHDYEEAAILADKVGILQNGSIVQQGLAKDVFDSPRSVFVANLTGIKNFFKAEKKDDNTLLIEGKVEISKTIDGNDTVGFITISNEQALIFRGERRRDIKAYNGIVTDVIPTKTGYEIIIDIGIILSVIMSKKAISQTSILAGEAIKIYIDDSDVKFIPPKY